MHVRSSRVRMFDEEMTNTLDVRRQTHAHAHHLIIHHTSYRVAIFGLAKAAHHNGKWGVVNSFDPVAGRYEVRLMELKPQCSYPT